MPPSSSNSSPSATISSVPSPGLVIDTASGRHRDPNAGYFTHALSNAVGPASANIEEMLLVYQHQQHQEHQQQQQPHQMGGGGGEEEDEGADGDEGDEGV